MSFTKNELVMFMDELVELASEENKARANLVKERFIRNFEKSYGYEKNAEAGITDMQPFYVAAMPNSVQEEIKEKVIARLTELGKCTPENVHDAMCSKIYDLAELIDIYKYVIQAEEEQKKKEKQRKREKR